MGLSFDSGGKYIGWSSLFSFDSIGALNASEYLPMPTGKRYKLDSNGTNIDSFIVDILAYEEGSVGRIEGYVKLLNYLNKNNIDTVTYTVDKGKEVFTAINRHELSKMPESLREDMLKNYVSSHIANTVQNLRNMVHAYQPIDMGYAHEAADLSPKQRESTDYTLNNPMTKMLMQYQNIVGKDVIGICANGEKAAFMWHYYLNEVYRSEDENKLNFADFEFTTSRIKSRSIGTPEEITINTLPDVNTEGLSTDVLNRFNKRLLNENGITTDLMISQLLSAATDFRKQQ